METFQLETPRGPAEVELTRPPVVSGPNRAATGGHFAGSAGAARTAGTSDPVALLALGHGAGGGVDAPDLRAVRRWALDAGVAVARITQPYRVAGRRAPAPAHHLDEAWSAVLSELPRRHPELGSLPLVVGGRSSGARVACRTAVTTGAARVVALAFPLHPPGRPERTRIAELDGAVPTLVVNGDRDPFGVPPQLPNVRVVVLPGEKHDLRKDPQAVASAVAEFLADLVTPGGAGG